MAVMTTERPRTEQPRMDTGVFEVIAIAAEREDVTLEFINGGIGVKPVPEPVNVTRETGQLKEYAR